MEKEMLEQRERELREQYPAMFSHHELKEGEVWLGDQLCDVSFINVGIYKSKGMPSARLGTGVIKPPNGFQYDPVFVNLHEFLKAEYEHQQTQNA